MKSQKAKKKQIKKIVKELIVLYARGEFKEADKLSDQTTDIFISFCKDALSEDLSFIIKNCHHFGMSTSDALEIFEN